MPHAPPTGLIQVHSVSGETRVVRRNVQLYSFQHASTGQWEAYPPEQCAAIEEACALRPEGGAVRLPAPGGGHGAKSNYEVRWGSSASSNKLPSSNRDVASGGSSGPYMQVHVTSGDTRNVRRNEFVLADAPGRVASSPGGDDDQAFIAAGADDAPAHLTDYVATRWYRAPEILLGSQEYSFGVDMWALGCILGEMINGKPLLTGGSTLNQIERILAVLGTPSEQDVASWQSPFAKSLLENAKVAAGPGGSQLSQSLPPIAPADAIDLIIGLLRYDPTRRLPAYAIDPSVECGLRHRYVDAFHMAAGQGVLLCESKAAVPIPPENHFLICFGFNWRVHQKHLFFLSCRVFVAMSLAHLAKNIHNREVIGLV